MLNKSYLKYLFLSFCWVGQCGAAEHVIRGVGMEWKPLITFVQPGDKIKFTEMVGHDTESIKGMIPLDTESWKSKMGEEGFTVILESDGLYLYRCNPHVAVGMFGAIVVGDKESTPVNLSEVSSNLKKVRIGKNAVRKILKKIEKVTASKPLN